MKDNALLHQCQQEAALLLGYCIQMCLGWALLLVHEAFE